MRADPEDRARGGAALRALPPGADSLGLGAALLGLAALAAWWGGTHFGDADAAEPALTVLVVDTSASVTGLRGDAALQVARRVREQASAAFARGDDVAVLTAGADVARRFGPSGDAGALDDLLRTGLESWLREGTLATDLDGAARLAGSLLEEPGRPPGHVVFFGDGVGTTGTEADRFLADARSVDVVELGPPTRHDLAVVDVRAPASVPPGVAPRVAVDLRLVGQRPANVGGPLRVRLDWEVRATRTTGAAVGGGAFLEAGHTLVPFTASSDGTIRTVPLVLPPAHAGSARLEVRAALAGADGAAIPDAFEVDDVGRAAWTSGDPDRVLLVGPPRATERVLRAFGGGAFEGFDVRACEPVALAAELAANPELDAIVTLDVPLVSLSADLLVDFVTERGGGWLHAAGWTRMRGDGGALARLEALEPDREPRKPRDVHLLVDGSGSMRGARWIRAREALGRLLPALEPSDRLALRLFTYSLWAPSIVHEPALDATPEERADLYTAVLERLRELEPTGGATDIESSVGAQVAALDTTFADGSDLDRERVVVLITDGVETAGGGDAERQRDAVLAAGGRLVALQVDEDEAARRYLQRYLAPGSLVRGVGELENLYAELRAAVEGSQPLEGGRLAPSPDGVAEGLRALAGDVRGRALPEGPAVERALPARPTAGAYALLDFVVPDGGDGGEGARSVALAVAERGAGLVAGLSFPPVDADGRAWAPAVLGDLGFVAPLLREMAVRRRAAPDPAGTEAGPVVTLEAGELWVRGLGEGARSRARIVADVVRPSAPDAFGFTAPDEVFASAILVPPSGGPDAAATRRAPRPPALDALPRGTWLRLRATDPPGAFPDLAFLSAGPREIEGLMTGAPPTVEPRGAGRLPGGTSVPAPGPGPRPAYVTGLALLGAVLLGVGAVARFERVGGKSGPGAADGPGRRSTRRSVEP